MPMRPKVKFLTVVWKEAYIARFAALVLPSFIAPGNLPALALATELEVVIMTRRADIGYFEKLAMFKRLREICPVRFVEIDDLVTTAVYGVTLTLAYARPIIACGREMLDTHFVFMNADFVLADGSLRSLCKHILDGRSIVLGPSFRATAEAVEPLLEAALEKEKSEGILAIQPRELAALSLPHPHPTTVAKILNQHFCHSTHPNQFFWQVDDQTMLGRYYLIFMLCLKPERVIETINCFCDYAFIAEMCPSGDEVVMDDSDDFFMLELQSRNQEIRLLRLGRPSEKTIAQSLQEWTTAEHRRAARYDVVFHAGEIPSEIETAKKKAHAFVDRIERRLGRPVPHATHKYWTHGVVAWQNYRKAQGLSASPRELAELPGGFRFWFSLNDFGISVLKWFWSVLYAGRRLFLGQAPHVTIFDPAWIDFRHLRDTFAAALDTPGARVLLVRDNPELVDIFVNREAFVQFTTLQEALDGDLPSPEHGFSGYSHVLIYLLRKDCRSVQKLIERCRPAMDPNGTCQVFIHNLHGEVTTNLSYELMYYIEDIIGSAPREVACWFVGGSLKQFNHRLFYHLLRRLWTLPLLTVALPLALLGNLYLRLKAPSRDFVPYCSSATIQFGPGEFAPREETSSLRREYVGRHERAGTRMA